MSDVLLVETATRIQKLQSIKTKKPHLGAPLPLVYISSYLLEANLDIDIIDLRVDSFEVLENYLREYFPALVGISIMPGNVLPRVIDLSRFIKSHSPSTKVVWGGSFPSLHYELCLKIPEVDFVVCGDGEETLSELALAVKLNKYDTDFSAIKGLAFRQNGNIVISDARKPVDLDNLPVAAWQLVDKYMEYYLGPRGYIAINSARGCPFKCTFCYNNLLYKGFKKYRARSVENTMHEIEYLCSHYEITKLQFMDDDFLAHRNRAVKLLETIKNKYPNMTFHIAARVDELNEEAMVMKLAEYGVESVFLGVESASPEQLDQMSKGCSANDTFETAKLCNKYGITPVYSFTCGYPDETEDNLFASVETARLLKDIDDNGWSVMEIISPIYGTPLYNDLQVKNQVPEMLPADWCYFSDWKSAKNKPWIKNSGFYEAFQLAFYFAFSSGGHSSGLRSFSKWLSQWSRFRLVSKSPKILPEYRFLNFLIKKAVWGFR